MRDDARLESGDGARERAMADAAGQATREPDLSARRLTQLKWLTTIVPAVAVFLYETVRHDLFEHRFPTTYGNLAVGFITLGFSQLIFGIVARLQDQAVARSREVAALNAVIAERERLSRELHDGLAQLVAYLLVRLDTVADLLAAQREAEALKELARLRTVADDLYADIRESIAALRTRLSERGLPATLRDYLAAFEERHDIPVDLRDGDLAADIVPLAGYQLLRIVQESLANVRKHAQATHAWVAFARPQPGWLALTIGDDGQGFDPSRASDRASLGLTAMRERAESLGGRATVESAPGQGTRVVVTFPTVPPPDAGN
ncbi:MAG: sensor histidine kinase [Thermomicrobiales bacterium]